MSGKRERRPPSYTTRRGKRGRHKAAGSPETRAAERVLGLPPVKPPALELEPAVPSPPAQPAPAVRPLPPRPPWMPPTTYHALTDLHERIAP